MITKVRSSRSQINEAGLYAFYLEIYLVERLTIGAVAQWRRTHDRYFWLYIFSPPLPRNNTSTNIYIFIDKEYSFELFRLFYSRNFPIVFFFAAVYYVLP